MNTINLSKYLEISDYEKPNDYIFTQENFEELNRINELTRKCVEYDFNKFMLITMLEYYTYFFEQIGEFELLFIGFKELKRISMFDILYENDEFKRFIKGLSYNFDQLNLNLIKENFKEQHYYDVAFIGDIEQFKLSLNPKLPDNDFGIDLF